MARIAGVDLPKDKRVEVGLTYIYGIGHRQSMRILSESQINPDTRVKNLTEEELGRLNAVISKGCKVEGT
ncbi:MAG: 30S ribosomal protein S13, partial [Candidatus Ratteibacteria bacterium]|nr:30S ribosomal protein S13 [Candidatus Ratteibacteria bacterium]